MSRTPSRQAADQFLQRSGARAPGSTFAAPVQHYDYADIEPEQEEHAGAPPEEEPPADPVRRLPRQEITPEERPMFTEPPRREAPAPPPFPTIRPFPREMRDSRVSISSTLPDAASRVRTPSVRKIELTEMTERARAPIQRAAGARPIIMGNNGQLATIPKLEAVGSLNDFRSWYDDALQFVTTMRKQGFETYIQNYIAADLRTAWLLRAGMTHTQILTTPPEYMHSTLLGIIKDRLNIRLQRISPDEMPNIIFKKVNARFPSLFANDSALHALLVTEEDILMEIAKYEFPLETFEADKQYNRRFVKRLLEALSPIEGVIDREVKAPYRVLEIPELEYSWSMVLKVLIESCQLRDVLPPPPKETSSNKSQSDSQGKPSRRSSVPLNASPPFSRRDNRFARHRFQFGPFSSSENRPAFRPFQDPFQGRTPRPQQVGTSMDVPRQAPEPTASGANATPGTSRFAPRPQRPLVPQQQTQKPRELPPARATIVPPRTVASTTTAPAVSKWQKPAERPAKVHMVRATGDAPNVGPRPRLVRRDVLISHPLAEAIRQPELESC